MTRRKNAARNIIYSFIFRVVGIVGPIVIRIIIIRTIGAEYIGVSGLFTSILSFLSLSELGFSNAIAYKCYSLYANNDIENLNRYLGYFKKVYKLIGCFIFVVGVVISPFLKYLIHDEYPKELNIYIIFYIYLIQTSSSYFLAAYRTLIYSVSQRKDLESKVAIVSNNLMYLVQIVLLLVFRNFYFYMIVLPITTMLNNFITIYITKKYFPNIVPKGDLTQDEKKEIRKSILLLIGHRIEGTIVISGDNVIISSFLGLTMVAEYNNYYGLIMSVGGFVTAIYMSIQPGIGNSVAIESKEKNYKDFLLLSFGISWLVGWMAICCLCLLQDFVSVAYGKEYLLSISTVVLLVIEFYIWRTCDLITMYRDVMGKWSGDAIIPYISGILNIIVNVLLVRVFGINGVIISTLIAFVLLSIPFSMRVLFTQYFSGRIKSYLIRYLKNSICLALIGALTYFTCSYICIYNIYIRMVIKLLICIVLPNLLFLFINIKNTEFIRLRAVIFEYFKKSRSRIDKMDM